MRTLRRPMFKIGGKAKSGNDGIMDGLVDREQLQKGTAADLFKSIGTPDRLEGLSYIPEVKTEEQLLQEKINAYTPKIDKSKVEDFVLGDRDLSTGQLKPKPFPETPGLSFPKDAEAMGADTSLVPTELDKDNDTSKIGTKDTGSNQVTQAEKNDILKARAKEFEELLNPGARKRVINNALAQASKAAGNSAGKTTLQTIADMITAGAGATGEIDKTKAKAAELAIGEDIQTRIAKAKDKPNATESLINFYRESGLSDKEITDKISKTSESELDYIKSYNTPSQAKAAYVSNVEMKDNPTFGGVLSNDKKTRTEELKTLSSDKLYYDSATDAYVKIVVKEGKQTTEIVKKR